MAKSSTTPLVDEWVFKAEGDWVCSQREIRARKNPNYDASCFHAQQCAEKYLKGVLQFKATPFKKTHDLEELLDSLGNDMSLFDSLRTDLVLLTDSAVNARYPGFLATKTDAKNMLAIATEVRKRARQFLSLPV